MTTVCSSLVSGIPLMVGPKGDRGERGFPGSIGPQGIEGLRGLPGPVNPYGVPGSKGEKGDGWSGTTVDPVTGAITFHSTDGLGFTTPSLRGERGKSAYELWIQEGNTGTLNDFFTALKSETDGTVEARIAGNNITEPCVVWEDSNGKVYLVDHMNKNHVYAITGIASGSSSQGGVSFVKNIGALDNPNWNFPAGSSIFLGVLGELVSVAPNAGYLVRVGVAISPTRVHINISDPILL